MKVLVSIPNTGWIHKIVMNVAISCLNPSRHAVTIITPTHSPYENNLHHIVNDFMDGDFDFWLNIDSDNPPAAKNPLKLIDLDLDIVGLPTPVWHFEDKVKGERPVYLNAYDFVPEEAAYKEHLPHEGLQEVDAVGTGCILISRRVFENERMRQAPFARLWNEDGTVDTGNDIAFCARAKRQGFRIFCDYDHPCLHFNEIELNEVTRAFHGVYA